MKETLNRLKQRILFTSGLSAIVMVIISIIFIIFIEDGGEVLLCVLPFSLILVFPILFLIASWFKEKPLEDRTRIDPASVTDEEWTIIDEIMESLDEGEEFVASTKCELGGSAGVCIIALTPDRVAIGSRMGVKTIRWEEVNNIVWNKKSGELAIEFGLNARLAYPIEGEVWQQRASDSADYWKFFVKPNQKKKE